MTLEFKRQVAVRGILVAIVICLYVSLLGGAIVRNYQISLGSLGIAAGFILLLSVLRNIFPSAQPPTPNPAQYTGCNLRSPPWLHRLW